MFPDEVRERIEEIRSTVGNRLYFAIVPSPDAWTVTAKVSPHDPRIAEVNPYHDPDAGGPALTTSFWLPRSAQEIARKLKLAHPGVTVYMRHGTKWLWIG